jgi:hypothetical protein
MTTSDVLDILRGATATNPSGTPYEERTRGVRARQHLTISIEQTKRKIST